jgi:hypothetical protein
MFSPYVLAIALILDAGAGAEAAPMSSPTPDER